MNWEQLDDLVSAVLRLAQETGRDAADVCEQLTAAVTRAKRSGAGVAHVEHATLHDAGVERRVMR